MPAVGEVCDTSDTRVRVSGNPNMDILMFPSTIWLALASSIIESRHTDSVPHSYLYLR